MASNKIDGRKRTVLSVLATALMILVAVFAMIPFAFMFMSSLKPGTEMMRYGLTLRFDPEISSFDNYTALNTYRDGVYWHWYKSSAMRNDSRLPAATRDKIQAAAKQLGYIPNSLASSLRSGRRNTVAVIINDVRNMHFCRLLSRLDSELRRADYNVMILCMKSDGALGMQMIQAAISQAIDGIIYFPNLEDREKIEYIRSHGIPLVLMDRYAEGAKADGVRSDDEQGGYLAMDHLLSLGHRRILYLAGPDYSSSQGDRLRGCRRAMEERHIGPEALRVISGNQNLADESIENCLFPVDYTAVIAFRDEIALFALQALRKREGSAFPGRFPW